MHDARASTAAPARVALALLAVYLLWGSTYPAIRVMVETVPPLLGTGLRYVAAGSLFALWLAASGRGRALRVGRTELAWSAVVGAALVAGGTGLVAVGERDVPAGLASLLFASAPLWVVLLRTLGGARVGRAALGWVLLGFAGVAVLLVPGERPAAASLAGLVVLLAAALAWAAGSLASERVPLPGDLLGAATLQMLLGGALTIVLAVAAGEADVRTEAISAESALAVAYLIGPGTLAAYTAYVWLLGSAPIDRVMTFAYVNPVVAVVTGWLVLDEELTRGMLVGSVLVLVSVAGTLRAHRG